MGAGFFDALATVLSIVFNFVQIVIVASVIISWVNADRSNQIVQMIHAVSEPIFRPFRKFTSKIPGPIDWTPMVVLLLIIFLQKWVIGTLMHLANS